MAREAHPKIWGCHAHFRHVNEYLEATLGLVKRLKISKGLICECVTVSGCCCIPLLYDHLMELCSYLRKNTLLIYWPPKGGAFAPPLPPLNPPLKGR